MVITSPESLRAEIEDDPLGVGYAQFVAAGEDAGVAALLNDTRGAGAGLVDEATLSPAQFFLGISPAYLKLPTLSDTIRDKWDRILNVLTGAGVVHMADPRVQALAASAITDGVLTQAEVAAIGRRAGSRAEVLFGAGASVGQDDISFALRGQR